MRTLIPAGSSASKGRPTAGSEALAGTFGVDGGEVVGGVPGTEGGLAFRVETEPGAAELDTDGEEGVPGLLEKAGCRRGEGLVVLEEQVSDPVFLEAFACPFEDAEFAAFDVEFDEIDGPGIREHIIQSLGLDLERALLVQVAHEASEAAIVGLVGSFEETDGSGGVGQGELVDLYGREAGMATPGADVRAELLNDGRVGFKGVDGAFRAGSGGQEAGHVADVGTDIQHAVARVDEAADGLANGQFEKSEGVYLPTDRILEVDSEREAPRQDMVSFLGPSDRSLERPQQIVLRPEPKFRLPQGRQASHEWSSRACA